METVSRERAVTVNFIDAKVGEQAHTWDYRPMGDEYGWVTSTEPFDDIDEPVTVQRQRWELVSETMVTFHPATMLCRDCDGEGDECERCHGDGRDPLAGTQEVLP